MPKPTSPRKKIAKNRSLLKPARFLDPRSDLVFKKIFGERKELTISFLNGILPFGEGRFIKSIEYLPSEQVPRIPTMKNTIVDVKCTDESGRIFIVEMQFNWFSSFMKRVLFGASKAYVQQLKKGENYESLCPVYGVAIINENFDKSDEWFHHYKTVNIKSPNKVLPGLELFFLELQKFQPTTLEYRKMGVLWLRFLKEINESIVEIPPEFTENPLICQALELSQESAYTPAQLEGYDRFWDAIGVERTIAIDARIEGEKIGREEGEKIGREVEKLETAKKLMSEGCSLEFIAKVTDLPVNIVQSMHEELYPNSGPHPH
jgi:predicted transposase/invertase (TIGR01784 family)